VNLVTLRLESGGDWPDAGLATALRKMNKYVILYVSHTGIVILNKSEGRMFSVYGL